MKSLKVFALSIGALAGAAYGQVPSTNDTSDANFNTGMGTGAFNGPAATNSGLGYFQTVHCVDGNL